MDLFACSAYQWSNPKNTIRKMFDLRNNVNYFTDNSDLDGQIQICSFREGQVGISGYLDTKRSFATFVQSKIPFPCIKQLLFYSETNIPSQAKSYRLTPWRKNEPGRADEIWVWLSKLVKANSIFWHLWSFEIPLHD